MKNTPAPYGAVPSPRQIAWHALEFYGFLHFTTNTFTDREWGYGDESPTVFNPTDFSASQIVSVAADAGIKGLILTCKHHDGFCLWPSRHTEHSVKNSPWKNGKGDVVREIADACARRGLRFGVYLSPWDRNRADYGRSSYVAYYRAQLRELLTEYGSIFEVWHDGANGGDGYYGGARETRRIDKTRYYGWPKTWRLVRDLQPDAVIFSDVGPDVRWVGNESGRAGETCWATLNTKGMHPGVADQSVLNAGQRNGAHWLPAEADVSIRPGWFYHAAEDARVRTEEDLTELYFQSIGRGAALLLNLPPDRRGKIHENDVAALRGMRRRLDSLFSVNQARGAGASATNTRGGLPAFAPANALDNDPNTYWATDNGMTTPTLTIEMDKPKTVGIVRLREHLPLGQRIGAFAVDVHVGGDWREAARGTSVGSQRLLRFAPVLTDRVRLRITEAPVCPALAEIALF